MNSQIAINTTNMVITTLDLDPQVRNTLFFPSTFCLVFSPKTKRASTSIEGSHWPSPTSVITICNTQVSYWEDEE